MAQLNLSVSTVNAPAIPAARFQERHIAFAGTSAEFAVNSRWQSIEDVGELLKAATLLKAGSSILPYGISTGFRSLAKLVAAIRDSSCNDGPVGTLAGALTGGNKLSLPISPRC